MSSGTVRQQFGGKLFCRECSEDSSYTTVVQHHKEPAAQTQPPQQVGSSGVMVWMPYNPDNSSDKGELVNSVVIAVSFGMVWASRFISQVLDHINIRIISFPER